MYRLLPITSRPAEAPPTPPALVKTAANGKAKEAYKRQIPQAIPHNERDNGQRLRGEGPPRLGGKGNGDLRYKFVIDVPASLSAEQDEAVDRLSKVMNGNPRAKLFPNGQPSAKAAEG